MPIGFLAFWSDSFLLGALEHRLIDNISSRNRIYRPEEYIVGCCWPFLLNESIQISASFPLRQLSIDRNFDILSIYVDDTSEYKLPKVILTLYICRKERVLKYLINFLFKIDHISFNIITLTKMSSIIDRKSYMPV